MAVLLGWLGRKLYRMQFRSAQLVLLSSSTSGCGLADVNDTIITHCRQFTMYFMRTALRALPLRASQLNGVGHNQGAFNTAASFAP